MAQEKKSDEINKIKQELKNLSASFSKMEDGFARIADVAEKVSENCIKRIINRRFYMQPSFWTAFIAVSGLIGLLLTWQQQIKAGEVSNIQKQIAAIQSFKIKENEAITKSRALIINQTISCPVTNITILKNMEKARVNSLIGIAAYNTGNTGLAGSNEKEIWLIVKKIVSNIYNIKLQGICRINANKFDRRMLQLQIKLNSIIGVKIQKKEDRLKRIESNFITF